MDRLRPLAVVILAAGQGTRMKSPLPKVLHEVGGRPMLLHVTDLAHSIGADRIIAIIGHGREKVEAVLQGSGVETVVQEQQLGTGHAVAQTEPLLRDFDGDLMVLSGDVPLLSEDSLLGLLHRHISTGAGATLMTANFADPGGYGRIVRDQAGFLDRIVEHKDCTPEQLRITEINAGIYIFDSKTLFRGLKMIDNNNSQGEYYLPDALIHFPEFGRTVALELLDDPLEIAGINTQEQLSEINRIFMTHQR
ncbi:MAG: NTP transferase domain-containing protein [Candidatus Neomarinimicrobiota bacterium]